MQETNLSLIRYLMYSDVVIKLLIVYCIKLCNATCSDPPDHYDYSYYYTALSFLRSPPKWLDGFSKGKCHLTGLARHFCGCSSRWLFGHFNELKKEFCGG